MIIAGAQKAVDTADQVMPNLLYSQMIQLEKGHFYYQ